MMTAPSDLRAVVQQHIPAAWEDLQRLVAFKSVADQPQYPIEGCLDAARYVASSFEALGFRDMQLLEMPKGHPAVYGEYPAPPGAPTVLLYSHYDVQPPLDEAAWQTPVFELTERDGRWYGRGAADCKGNIVMQLTALRALGGGAYPVGLKVISEGSEEQGLDELEEFAPRNPELLRADAILVCDTGNTAVGQPTLTTTLRGLCNVVVTVRTLRAPKHSGMFGGPAPDALVALIKILDSLHDARGNVTIQGIDNGQTWQGTQYDTARFREDASVLDGVDLPGDGSVSDMLWARPSLTVLAIDCPRIAGSAGVVQAEASAKVSLRIPPGIDRDHAMRALQEHIRKAAPWRVELEIDEVGSGSAFQAEPDGPATRLLRRAMQEAYGREMGMAGQGGSIPLCNVLKETVPQAEIMLMGVEEPQSLMHAPNESVDPSEIENMALGTALFLRNYGIERAA
jgi:acetylornithine deacetylase/succinyl-diaminopimelate desuccinylase-like protein